MPKLHTNLKPPALAAHKNLSYEMLLSAWLTGFGWEALIPLVDHGRRTDLVIADDEGRYYRIQVKTVQSTDEAYRLENRWHGARLDYIVIFSPVGQVKFPHLWPGQIPPGRTVRIVVHVPAVGPVSPV